MIGPPPSGVKIDATEMNAYSKRDE